MTEAGLIIRGNPLGKVVESWSMKWPQGLVEDEVDGVLVDGARFDEVAIGGRRGAESVPSL